MRVTDLSEYLDRLGRGGAMKLSRVTGIHPSDISRIKKRGRCRIGTARELERGLRELGIEDAVLVESK